jgi:hypothetical protein
LWLVRGASSPLLAIGGASVLTRGNELPYHDDARQVRKMRRKTCWVAAHVTVDDSVIDAGDLDAVIDPMRWTICIYGDESAYDESLKSFSQEQRYLFAMMWHAVEVENGGHDQFYFNSTGIVWRDALSGYKEVGLTEAAAILEESAVRLGGNPSRDRLVRQQQLNAAQNDLDDLDSRFYRLLESIEFNEVLISYIKRHRNAFYFDGIVRKPKS